MTPGPYHLLSLGTLLLFSYFLSLLLVRYRLISKLNHRKFWNTLLLFFFLATSLLGFFLAVKVNYKLDIPWIEEALSWHVESGLGFAFIAFFHLLWHFTYYTQLLKRSRQEPVPLSKAPSGASSTIVSGSKSGSGRVTLPRSRERLFFILLGYISIMAQLVLLREFIKNFHGNELVIGIFLAVWMILTAGGARMGSGFQGSISVSRLKFLLILLSAYPLLIYLLLLLLSRFIFLPGYQPELLNILISIVLLISLFTGLSGFLFGYLSGSVKQRKKGVSQYMLDAIGSLFGGFLFAAVLVHLLSNFQILVFLLLATTIVIAIFFHYPDRFGWRWILITAGAALFILSLFPDFQYRLEEFRYRDEKVLDSKDTPYGNMTITSLDEQITGYLDGNPVFSSSNLRAAEESVHFPALQHPCPKAFLLLGGGLSGQVDEAEKYKPERIDYAEADPWIYRLGKAHFMREYPASFHFINEDGRSWLMQNDGSLYDVIISNYGNPSTLGWNRYFTMDFYSMVKDRLSPGGVFCMHLNTAENYVNEEGIRLLGINMNTLGKVFTHIVVVPGIYTYFLASEEPISLDFPSMISKRQIRTSYVNSDYLDAMHIQFDSEQLSERIRQQEVQTNRDLWPRLFFATLSGIQSKTGRHSMEVAGIISVLVFLVLLFRYGPVKRAMYVTGFSGAGIQILLIMALQSFYGYAYMLAPLMITLFMAGIVTGIITKGVWGRYSMNKLLSLVMIMSLIALICLLTTKTIPLSLSRFPGQLTLGVLNFIPGIVVGWVYALGVIAKEEKVKAIRGELYSADLTGAALGTILPTIFFLPLIGMANTFILLFGINLATGLSLMIRALKLRAYG